MHGDPIPNFESLQLFKVHQICMKWLVYTVPRTMGLVIEANLVKCTSHNVFIVHAPHLNSSLNTH